MLTESLGDSSIDTHDNNLRLFCSVGPNQSNKHLIAFGHVKVRVPEPLNDTYTLHKDGRDFALQKKSFALRIAACGFIEIEFTLQTHLLDQHGLTRLLRKQ